MKKDWNMPDQRSTYEQIIDVLQMAVDAGMYDAADFLKHVIQKNWPTKK